MSTCGRDPVSSCISRQSEYIAKSSSREKYQRATRYGSLAAVLISILALASGHLSARIKYPEQEIRDSLAAPLRILQRGMHVMRRDRVACRYKRKVLWSGTQAFAKFTCLLNFRYQKHHKSVMSY